MALREKDRKILLLPSNRFLSYHTSPREYKRGDRVVWLCHALTANSDPLDWWPEMVGEGCCVDPDQDFVVCVNIFGSAYGTTGPRSLENPLSFPKFTVRDTARLFTLVREHLASQLTCRTADFASFL